MKKTLFIGMLLFALSCGKEENEFRQNTRQLNAVNLPSQFLGKWLWIGSSGGWVDTQPKANEKQVLTINANQTYQVCKNDICDSGRWFFGWKNNDSGKHRDTMLVLESLKLGKDGLGFMTHSQPRLFRDTLVMSSFCNDCSDPIFVRN